MPSETNIGTSIKSFPNEAKMILVIPGISTC